MAVRFSRPLLLAAASLLVAASACNDTSAPEIEKTEFRSSLGVDLAASTKTPSGLYYRDIVVGTGAVADTSHTATVLYSLYNINGSRWDTGTISFKINAQTVVKGFAEGVTGMRIGGRRQLIVPPDLGYGTAWAGDGKIPPNSILVFDVTLQGLR